jgi:hypothetical protein
MSATREEWRSVTPHGRSRLILVTYQVRRGVAVPIIKIVFVNILE